MSGYYRSCVDLAVVISRYVTCCGRKYRRNRAIGDALHTLTQQTRPTGKSFLTSHVFTIFTTHPGGRPWILFTDHDVRSLA